MKEVMKHAFWIGVLLLWVAVGGYAQPQERGAQWPEALDAVKPYGMEEAEFAERFHGLAKSIRTMARAELAMAEQFEAAGEKEQAREKMVAATARLRALRVGYETSLGIFSHNACLLNDYGELLYDFFGDGGGAVRAWEKSVSFDDDYAPPRNNLGMFYMHAGMYAQGFDHMDKALSVAPKNPDYLFNMVQAYLIHAPQVESLRGWSKGRIYKKAMKMSKKAAALAPDDFQLLQDYAVNFFAAENFGVKANWRKAAKAWQVARPKAANTEQTFYTWLNEARVWIKAEKWDEAKKCLDEAIRLRPQSETAQQLLREVSEKTSPPKKGRKRP